MGEGGVAPKFREKFKIKVRGILGPDPHDTHEISVLNRVVSWGPEGLTFEADQRHGEIILKTLGYESVKGVSTPGVQDSE